MTPKLMHSPKDNTQNYSFRWWKLLDNHLKERTNQNSVKVSKLLDQQIRKHYYKTLGTSVINSPLSTLSRWERDIIKYSGREMAPIYVFYKISGFL